MHREGFHKPEVGLEDALRHASSLKDGGEQVTEDLVETLVDVGRATSQVFPCKGGHFELKGSKPCSIFSSVRPRPSEHLREVPLLDPRPHWSESDGSPYPVQHWQNQQSPVLEAVVKVVWFFC